VVFALDASGSIGFDNFQRMTQFVGMLVQTLDIDSVTSGPTISRVGLVTSFSDSAVLHFNLDRYTTKASLLQAVNVPYLAGSHNTAEAIRLSKTNYQRYTHVGLIFHVLGFQSLLNRPSRTVLGLCVQYYMPTFD